MIATLQHYYYAQYRHTAATNGVTAGGAELLEMLASRGRMEKAELIHRLGWQDRKVRKEVELLRRAGVPVMASSGEQPGYWLADSVEEVHEFVAHEFDSRIAALEAQRAALRATAQRMLDAELQGADQGKLL